MVTTWVRSFAPNLEIMFVTCPLTVASAVRAMNIQDFTRSKSSVENNNATLLGRVKCLEDAHSGPRLTPGSNMVAS
jgi:hypothetical protein